MAVSPEEFWQALTGEADDDVRKRVIQAIEDGDPDVKKMIEQRKRRALVWLKLLGDQSPGIVEFPTDANREGESKGKDDV